MNRSLWMAGLMAGLIVALAGSSARAGFSFQINAVGTGTPNDGFKIAELPNGSFTVVKPGDNAVTNAGEGPQNATVNYTASGSLIKGTATIDGTSFNFRVSSNQDSSSGQGFLTVNLKSVNNSGSAHQFGFYTADGLFPTPSKTMYLQARMHSFPDYTPGGAIAFSNANLVGTGNHTAQTGFLTGPSQTTVSNVVPVTLSNPYSLSNVGGDLKLAPGATAHFLSSGSFSTPEPTGVLLGLFGLPCMGGLVSWVRRRRAVAAA